MIMKMKKAMFYRNLKASVIESQINFMIRINKIGERLIDDESGMGMVEIALIIIIIIALGLTFKKAINDFLESIFASFDISGYK